MFVVLNLLSCISYHKALFLFFAKCYFSGHTFALGTETFIPRSQWDVKHLVRDIPSPASLAC